MCSAPKATPPAPVTPPPEAPKQADQAVQQARSDERRRAASAQGAASTILTGPQGVTDAAATAKKTLLGA
jgi:hypothetical protein